MEFNAINGTVRKKKKEQLWKFASAHHKVREFLIIFGEGLLRSKTNRNFKNTLNFPREKSGLMDEDRIKA